MSNKECEIVQDLLPLYYDKACSEASCSFVEKHMAGCSDCQKTVSYTHLRAHET